MKDRFKFRVWDGEKLHHPDFITFYDDGEWEAYCISDPKKIAWSEHENHVVMQCTGRKDRNGELIYEGDVLKAHGYVIWNDIEDRWSAVDLNWNDQREIHALDYLTSPFEVIGNIYENPDLLT